MSPQDRFGALIHGPKTLRRPCWAITGDLGRVPEDRRLPDRRVREEVSWTFNAASRGRNIRERLCPLLGYSS